VSKKLTQLLGRYVRNLEPDAVSLSFLKGEGSLDGLVLDEAQVARLLSLPASLAVAAAHCNRARAKVQWTRLADEPITVWLDVVDIVVEERDPDAGADGDAAAVAGTAADAAQPRPSRRGYMDRVAEGLRLEINQIRITVRTRGGAEAAAPPEMLYVDMVDVSLRSTSKEWAVVPLSKTRCVRL
jgi:hypothetical protein